MSNCFKFDLHIHTPASSCYKGTKDDSEYIEILRTAQKQNLSLIAITDHNTIDGYLHLMEIKQEKISRIKVLDEYKGTSSQLCDAVKLIENELKLFDSVYIVPGVEITLDPGIHIQVFSHPQEYEKLSELLNAIGYTEGKRGADSEYSIDYDVKRFLALSELEGLLVVAPHVDSSNGLNNSALSGQYRSEIMKLDILTAFSCNSVSQKEKLISLFTSDPHYKRTGIPAFINCSDAHAAKDVGSKYSFFRADKCDFISLVEALNNPADRILDTDEDYILKSIKKIKENESCFFLDTLTNVDETRLATILCACLNAGIQNIMFGISKDIKLIGLRLSEEQLRKMLMDAFSKLMSQATGVSTSISFEHLENGGIIAIYSLEIGQKTIWCTKENNTVFDLDSDYNVYEPSIFELENLIKSNTLNAIKKYDRRNKLRIYEIDTKLLSMSNMLNKYNMQQKIYQQSSYILNKLVY